MELFYVRPDHVADDVLFLDDFERRHVVSTLRKGLNDTILVTDGQGTLFTGVIKKTAPRLVVEIKKKEIKPKNPVALILACGFIKKNRMDFILEKGTELGVAQFLFFRSRYANYSTTNLQRLNKVVRQALKQSLHYYFPKIQVFRELDDFFASPMMPGERFIAIDAHYPQLTKLLGAQSDDFGQSVTVVVGPEGGFAEEELAQFKQRGFKGFSLGPHRLRTETAAIASLAIVSQYIHK